MKSGRDEDSEESGEGLGFDMAPGPERANSDLFLGKVALQVVLWYTISASIIFVSKWMLSGRFPFPLTVTTCSNFIVGALATLATLARPKTARSAADGAALNASDRSQARPNVMSYVWPIAICTALEIGCSNAALRVLTVSFGTILKGSAPVFVLLWGFALRVERFSWQLVLVVSLISGGIAISAVGETDFHLGGFILQIVAVSFGGLRWALTHILLKGRGIGLTPLKATLYTAPMTSVFVAPIAVVLEGRDLKNHLQATKNVEDLHTAGILLIIGSLVFLLLLLEYSLVRDTSSLAVSVAAVFKELVTIFGGVLIFHDVMSLLNWVGFAVAHVGIALYIQIRQTDEPVDNPLRSRGGPSQTPLLPYSTEPQTT